MTDHANIDLPPILVYPSTAIQEHLLPEEWDACLDIWIASVELRLKLADKQLSDVSIDSLGVSFLIAHCLLHSAAARQHATNPKNLTLQRICKAYLQRILMTQSFRIPPLLLFDLLGSGSSCYLRSESWNSNLRTLWQRQQKQIKKSIESAKTILTTAISSTAQLSWLRKLSALTKALPAIATVTAAGADYLDTLTDLYQDGTTELKEAVTENLFCSFIALLQEKHISILTDNVYHLKSESDRLRKLKSETGTVLSSLLCTTTFLRHLSASHEIATRKKTLLDQLGQHRRDTLHLHPIPPRPRQRKGKSRATEDNTLHLHKAAQLSQVHELFPDLHTAYILKVLDFYNNDTEASIAALLEPDMLPANLQEQGVTDQEQFDTPASVDLEPQHTAGTIPKRSEPPEDESDRLEIEYLLSLRSKKPIQDMPLSPEGHARSKAAILAALAAFDSDDDERDDTYDVADIGGAVDNTVDSDERRHAPTDPHEGTLFNSWKGNPELFARDSKTRSSNIRQQLKRETGLSDEQIEGWAIMLNKDKKMQDRLADKYSASTSFSGQQRAIESTKWQANISAENSETESGAERSNDTRRMGQAGIRGHRNFGRGRGRGGGDPSGPPSDAAVQRARKRKEQGRGRGGANSRRDARAKKVGRGMGPINPS